MIRLVDVYQQGQPRAAAISLLYKLLLERPAYANISHRYEEQPSYEKHSAFVFDKPYRYWYIIEAEQGGKFDSRSTMATLEWIPQPVPVGAISATQRNEIGIAILQEYRQRGYAAAAITQFCMQHRPLEADPSRRAGAWLANVAPGNGASHALFQRLGAKQIQITYEL